MAHRIDPVKIELGARALPIHSLSSDDDPPRVWFAILVSGNVIELPASRLLAILCQASFSGCFAWSSIVSLCHIFFVPAAAVRWVFEHSTSPELF